MVPRRPRPGGCAACGGHGCARPALLPAGCGPPPALLLAPGIATASSSPCPQPQEAAPSHLPWHPRAGGGQTFVGPPPARSSPHITPTCAHRAARCPPGPAGFKLSRCWALSLVLGANYCFGPGDVIAPLPPFTSRFAPAGPWLWSPRCRTCSRDKLLRR